MRPGTPFARRTSPRRPACFTPDGQTSRVARRTVRVPRAPGPALSELTGSSAVQRASPAVVVAALPELAYHP